MNKTILITGIIAIVLLSTITLSADARLKSYEMTLTLDNTEYEEGDTITITSEINYPPEISAHFIIYDPSNVLVYSGMETVRMEAPFTHTLVAGDNSRSIEWVSGIYTIIGWYSDSSGELPISSFQYTTTEEEPQEPTYTLQEQITTLQNRITSLEESPSPYYYTVEGDKITLRANHNFVNSMVSCNSDDIAISAGLYKGGTSEGLEGLIIISSIPSTDNNGWKYSLTNTSSKAVSFAPTVQCVSYP